ncbi:MAG: GGDEF domain-containing protein [Oligoflexales bacterium]
MKILLYMSQSGAAEIGAILQTGGYETEWADQNQSFEEFLANGALRSTALVIMDFVSQSGVITAAEVLRRSRESMDVPVMVVSSSSAPEVLQTAFAAGACDFIGKPVVDYELLSRVRLALRMKHEIDSRIARERQLEELNKQLGDLNAVLNRLSLIDGLVGTPNRRCFDQSLDQEWRACQRRGVPLTLLMIDIDHFKSYNDTHGHQAGDECLKKVAKIIGTTLRRPTDLLARYGGEEFAAILPETSAEGAKYIAEQICQAVAQAKLMHGGQEGVGVVTISVGAATCAEMTDFVLQDLMKAADDCLYQAKDRGRNQVVALELCPKGKKLETSA